MRIKYNFAFKNSKLSPWERPAPPNLLVTDASIDKKLVFLYQEFNKNAEIFYPPYLFTKDKDGQTVFAERPKIEKIQSEVSDRSNLQIMTENTQNISKISLISTGSTTHAQSSELKFRFLEFNKISKKELSAKIDENRSSIQSGSYLVYLINDKGVPSEGKVVFIK